MSDEDNKTGKTPSKSDAPKAEVKEPEPKAEIKKTEAKADAKADPQPKAVAKSEEEESEEEDSEEEEKKAVPAKAAKVAPKKEAKAPAPPKAKASPLAYPLNEKWSGLWKIFAGVGAVASLAAFAGASSSSTRFAYSWLFGFLVALTLAIGSMMWVLVQHLTSAGWSVTVRRTAEFFASGAVAFVVLVIPVLLSMNILFAGWLNPATGEHKAEAALVVPGQHQGELAQNDHSGRGGVPAFADAVPDQGAPIIHLTANKHGDPEEMLAAESMKTKTWWLTKPFFIARAILFVLIWALLGTFLLRRSVAQDTSKDPQITVKIAKVAPVLTMALAFSLTFAAFDWIMSLEPTWYSTIFGVNFFASSFLAIHAVLIITLFSMRQDGMLVKEVSVEHYHDLGKLQFGFLVFWAYISFAQFMLIWYAGIPEETTWYHHRWDVGPWAYISMGLLILHFVVPFFLILSRNTKRKIDVLRAGSVIILAMHVVELYWFVMPNLPKQEDFAFHWLDIVCLVGPVCLYLAVVFRNMATYSLIPVGDPRLSRALKFINQ